MRLAAGQFRELTHADLRFAHAIGCSGVTVNKPDLDSPAWVAFLGKQFSSAAGPRPPTLRWNALDLANLRAAVEGHGLSLDCIEGVPRTLIDRAILGLPGGEEQIEHFKATIRAMGQAGIGVLGYAWIPDQVWRTTRNAPARGGALATEYDHAIGARIATGTLPPRDDAAMWANWERFITAVLPVAEASGVRLSLHPDDPPVAMLDGVARIFRDAAAFDRAMRFADSVHHGIAFCTGTFAEAGAEAMHGALLKFLAARKVHYVHLRSVIGALPRFAEAFHDEGTVDAWRVVQALAEYGFDGFIIDDHVPHLEGDTVWGHRSRAFATGYISGLLRAVRGQ
jgi:mannonate dehydratase